MHKGYILFWISLSFLFLVLLVVAGYFIYVVSEQSNCDFFEDHVSKVEIMATPKGKFKVYNPSLLFYENKILYTYRKSQIGKGSMLREIIQSVHSEIGRSTILFRHSNEKEFTTLNIKPENHTNEDVRPILFGEFIYFVSSQNYNFDKDVGKYNTMSLIKLNKNTLTYIDEIQLTLDGSENRCQKNWMPFIFKNKLYFVYSVSPHIIVECNVESGKCKEVYNTKNSLLEMNLRGGSQAIRITTDDFDFYTAIVHTKSLSKGYSHNIYCFEPKEPFNVRYVSKPFKMSRSNYKFDIPPIVEFVSGLAQIDDNTLRITWGAGNELACMTDILISEFIEMATENSVS